MGFVSYTLPPSRSLLLSIAGKGEDMQVAGGEGACTTNEFNVGSLGTLDGDSRDERPRRKGTPGTGAESWKKTVNGTFWKTAPPTHAHDDQYGDWFAQSMCTGRVISGIISFVAMPFSAEPNRDEYVPTAPILR